LIDASGLVEVRVRSNAQMAREKRGIYRSGSFRKALA
jgi:hypothetical protein